MEKSTTKADQRRRRKLLLSNQTFLAFVPLSVLNVVCVVLSGILWNSSVGTTIAILLVLFDLTVAPLGLGIFYLVSDLRKQNYIFLKSLVAIELALLTPFIVVLLTRFALSGHFDNVFVKPTDPETSMIRSSIFDGHIFSTLLVGAAAQLFLCGAWIDNRLKKAETK